MINISNLLASKIKKASPGDTASIEVMEYALAIILNTASIITVTLLIGWLTKEWLQTSTALFFCMVLRFFSGGIHMRSLVGCFFFSVITLSIIPHLPDLNPMTISLTSLFSMLIMILYAPHIDSETNLDRKYWTSWKIISVLLAGSTLVLHSSVLAYTMILQSFFVIPWKRRKKHETTSG